jgi:hypothetical protein
VSANAELLRHMARAAAGEWDAGVERDLVRAIAAAGLVVPVREEPGGERGLWATADDDGRTQVVAFTDPAGVEAWAGHPVAYAVMPGVELCAVAVRAGAGALWINPGGIHGGRLDARMVAIVAAARSAAFEGGDGNTARMRTIGAGGYRLRAPADGPADEALAHVRGVAAGTPGLCEAWLVEIADPPPAHLAIVALIERTARGDPLAPLTEAAARLVGPEQFVDVLGLEHAEDAVLVRARELGVTLRSDAP